MREVPYVCLSMLVEKVFTAFLQIFVVEPSFHECLVHMNDHFAYVYMNRYYDSACYGQSQATKGVAAPHRNNFNALGVAWAVQHVTPNCVARFNEATYPASCMVSLVLSLATLSRH